MASERTDVLLIQKYAFLDLEVDTTTMQLFNHAGKAEKKWHKKALFLDSIKSRIVLDAATKPKPKIVLVENPKSIHMPPWMYKGNRQVLNERITWNQQLRRVLRIAFGE